MRSAKMERIGATETDAAIQRQQTRMFPTEHTKRDYRHQRPNDRPPQMATRGGQTRRTIDRNRQAPARSAPAIEQAARDCPADEAQASY